jgi:hypothetical protein
MDDPNNLHHIFGSRRHNLDRLVRQFGSREAARRAIEDAVSSAFQAGELTLNARGVFEKTVDVGGNQVTVRGVIHLGEPRIGSAWILG